MGVTFTCVKQIVFLLWSPQQKKYQYHISACAGAIRICFSSAKKNENPVCSNHEVFSYKNFVCMKLDDCLCERMMVNAEKIFC